MRHINKAFNNYTASDDVSFDVERGELAALYKGVPQNDLGIRTDILENIDKNMELVSDIKVIPSTLNTQALDVEYSTYCNGNREWEVITIAPEHILGRLK